MKLRAPRCSDGRLRDFVVGLSAASRRARLRWPKRRPRPSNSASAATTHANLVGMVGHSFGNRAVAVGLGYERQQDEEREVQRRADARQQSRTGRRRACRPSHISTRNVTKNVPSRSLRGEAAIADRLVLARDRATAGTGTPRTDSAISSAPRRLIRNRAQDRVVRREVPHRRDVLGRRHRIRRLEVRRFHEQAAERRHEEHHDGEQRQEQADADDVLERVVRMERDAVDRLAVGARAFP